MSNARDRVKCQMGEGGLCIEDRCDMTTRGGKGQGRSGGVGKQHMQRPQQAEAVSTAFP